MSKQMLFTFYNALVVAVALHTSAKQLIYVHEWITISLVVELEAPRTNLTTMYFTVCRTRNRNCFFQILAFMKLAKKQNLLFYEKLFQSRRYDVLNKA